MAQIATKLCDELFARPLLLEMSLIWTLPASLALTCIFAAANSIL